MKPLKDYADIIYSTRDFVVFVIIYDATTKKEKEKSKELFPKITNWLLLLINKRKE